MADDITLNAGSGGSIVSTEQLTSGGDSSHAQRIKIINGAAHTDGGDVTPANPFPVAIEVSGSPVDPRAVRALTSSDVITAAQGTAAGLGGAWPVELTDGTHTTPTGDAQARAIQVTPGDGTRAITVKAASTAAAAGDTAEVVSLSPNSPIPYPTRTPYSSIAAASLVVKNSAGTLYSIRIRNRSAAPVYAMVFNSTSVPADGTVTPFLPPFLVPAGSDVSFGTDYFTDSGFAFSTGISIAVSTTDSTTKTLAGTAANHDISGAFT